MEISADGFVVKDALEGADLAKKVTLLLNIAKEPQPSEVKFDHNRRWPRIPVNIPSNLEVYHVHEPHISNQGSSIVENISLGGAYLSQIHLKKGNIPSDTFRFLLKIDQPPLNDWEAESVFVNLFNNGTAGLKFVKLSKKNQIKLSLLVEN